MGIKGLESYIDRYCPEACQKVNIQNIVALHKKYKKTRPLIIIDGRNAARFLYTNEVKTFVHGGQLKQFEEVLKLFISKLQYLGVELVFFFRGISFCPDTIEEWEEKEVSYSPPDVPLMLKKIACGFELNKVEQKLGLLPENLVFLSVQIAKSMGCKVFGSTTKVTSFHIAEYAHKEGALAIFSQDTYFLMFNSAVYYLSLKHLKIKELTTLSYIHENLCKHLKLLPSHLPLFAALIENTKYLKEFHQNLLFEVEAKRFYQPHAIISKVASFITNYKFTNNLDSQKLKDIASIVFDNSYNGDKFALLQKRLPKFDIQSGTDIVLKFSECDKWNEILEKLFNLQKHMIIVNEIGYILLNQTYANDVSIASHFKENFEVLKELREKLYGILLFEKPEETEVTEFWKDKSSTVIMPVKPKVFHPGLIALWYGDTTNQWNLISDVFGVHSDKILSLPHHLIIPGLAFRYLYGKIEIESWELDALISSTCLLSVCNTKYLSANPYLNLTKSMCDLRPISLYNLVTYTFSKVLEVFNAVGDPLPSTEILPSRYQDGMFFNLKYAKAKAKDCGFEGLCDNMEIVISWFKQLKSFVTKLET